MKLVYAVLLLLLATAPGRADYYWYPCKEPGFEHWLMLLKDDATVGGYDRKHQQYRPLLDAKEAKWGGPSRPPHPVPDALKDYNSAVKNYGVEAGKIHAGYSLNGKPISKTEAYQIVGDKTLVDDSQRLRLTIVGPESERAKVTTDLTAKLKDLTKDLVIAGYDPDHWHVDGLFQRGIYYQKPDGSVLARGDTYPGAKLFGTVLRKAHPDYDPSKDPEFKSFQRTTIRLDWNTIRAIPTWVWVLLGAIVVYLFTNRKRT